MPARTWDVPRPSMRRLTRRAITARGYLKALRAERPTTASLPQASSRRREAAVVRAVAAKELRD